MIYFYLVEPKLYVQLFTTQIHDLIKRPSHLNDRISWMLAWIYNFRY